MSKESNTWAMILHLSLLAGFIIPLGGLIVPIVIWQLKKDEFPSIDAHGKMAVNFIISMAIYTVIALILTFVLIGIFLLMLLAVVGVVLPIIAGIKANSGEVWDYPGMIKFFK